MNDYKCVFCGRTIKTDELMFRYPSDNAKVIDEIYAKALNSKGIMKGDVQKTEACDLKTPNIVKLIDDGTEVFLVTKNGVRINDKICPTCHFTLFRDINTTVGNAVPVFGLPKSGRTTLITAMANSVIQKSYEAFDMKYIPFFNEYVYPERKFANDTNTAISGGHLSLLKYPVVIHRMCSARYDGDNVTDVFYDIDNDSLLKEESFDYYLPNIRIASRIAVTVPADFIFEEDYDKISRNDMILKQYLYRVYFALKREGMKNARINLVVTKADIVNSPEQSFSEEQRLYISGLMLDNAGLKKHFSDRFTLSAEFLNLFSSYEVSAVSAFEPEMCGEGTDILLKTYHTLVDFQ